jgi:flagellar biosynthesis protein FlhA
VLKPGEIQRVLQAMLRERLPIRDLESILESIADVAPRSKDTEILTEYARHAIARMICHQHAADDGKVHCVTLDPSLEELLGKSIERSAHGAVLTLPPALQTKIVDAVRVQVEQTTPLTRGRPPVLLCPPQVRPWVRKMIEGQLPMVSVLSYNEVVRGFEVESHGMVELQDES